MFRLLLPALVCCVTAAPAADPPRKARPRPAGVGTAYQWWDDADDEADRRLTAAYAATLSGTPTGAAVNGPAFPTLPSAPVASRATPTAARPLAAVPSAGAAVTSKPVVAAPFAAVAVTAAVSKPVSVAPAVTPSVLVTVGPTASVPTAPAVVVASSGPTVSAAAVTLPLPMALGSDPARPAALPAAAAPLGKPKRAAAGTEVGSDLMLFLAPGADGAAVARTFGLTAPRRLAAEQDVWVARAADPAAAAAARSRAAADPRVQSAFAVNPNFRVHTQAFTPNDPFFFPGTNPPVGGPGDTSNPNYPGQWHLVNNMPAASYNTSPFVSAGLAGAWANNWTGAGITIGVVDDSVQVDHPDLAPNNTAVAALNRNFSSVNSGSPNDPRPAVGGDVDSNHGTSVAGVAAARGGNGVGVSGAAPQANLVGIRTELEYNALIAALGHANGPASTPNRIQVKNHSYGAGDTFDGDGGGLANALRLSAQAGTVNLFSAGNERGTYVEDSNKQTPQNSTHSITVAAFGSNNKFASYSSFGANVFVTAPSNSSGGFPGIATTDRTGSDGYNTNGNSEYASTAGGGTGLGYTRSFGGTSSSAPLAAGVVALALQANPALETRGIKHLLARTSTVVDAGDSTASSDGGWRTNAGGFRFNQNYGFGLINAAALTQQAQQYSGVTAQTTFTKPTTSVGAAIPDAPSNTTPGAFVSRTFAVNVIGAARQPVEDVSVTLGITHPYRGDLEAFVQSPSGYRSRLFSRASGDSTAYPSAAAGGATPGGWEFLTNAFWGEDPNGTWQIDVRDTDAGDTGTWDSYAVTIRMGTLVPVPEPAGLLAAVVVALAGWRRAARG